MRLSALAVLVLPALAWGCADEPTVTSVSNGGTGGTGTGGDVDDETGPTDASGVSQPATGSSPTSTGPDPTSSSGDTAPDGPEPAHGIGITAIHANQGVEVPLWKDGAYVDEASRNAQLVKGRNMLVRALWITDDGFTPRAIEARLTLAFPDGGEEIAEKTFEIAGTVDDADLETNIYFVLPGEFVQPGIDFQLELFETEPGHEDEPLPEVTAYPPEPSAFGVLDAPMVLRSVIVPVHHDLGAHCPVPPTFDEQTLQPFIDRLYMQNPAEVVEIEVRDAVAYTGDLSSFNGLLGFLADLREQDGADPEAYYYGLVRPCDGGPDGVGGQAISIPDFPTIDNAWTRTAVGRWNTGSLSSTANTYVHEIGHTQGRRHVACSGDEGGPDPSYPYPGGTIGVWGFGIIDFTLHTPGNAKDYMTYCGNTWVSDWGWQSVVPFIEEISGWNAMAPPPEPGRLLVGLVDDATGAQTWFTTRGALGGRVVTGTELLTITDPDGLRTEVEGTVGPMGEPGAHAIAIPLPADLPLHGTRITRADGTPITAVREHGERVTLPVQP